MRCGVAQPASYYGLAYWREIRERIIARDGGCVHCGMTEQEHRQRFGCSLHVHHKISRAKGGSDDESNLETRCCGSHAQETNSGR
jgi:5-methylcytosine-specific restriction endonuclease McrA